MSKRYIVIWFFRDKIWHISSAEEDSEAGAVATALHLLDTLLLTDLLMPQLRSHKSKTREQVYEDLKVDKSVVFEEGLHRIEIWPIEPIFPERSFSLTACLHWCRLEMSRMSASGMAKLREAGFVMPKEGPSGTGEVEAPSNSTESGGLDQYAELRARLEKDAWFKYNPPGALVVPAAKTRCVCGFEDDLTPHPCHFFDKASAPRTEVPALQYNSHHPEREHHTTEQLTDFPGPLRRQCSRIEVHEGGSATPVAEFYSLEQKEKLTALRLEDAAILEKALEGAQPHSQAMVDAGAELVRSILDTGHGLGMQAILAGAVEQEDQNPPDAGTPDEKPEALSMVDEHRHSDEE